MRKYVFYEFRLFCHLADALLNRLVKSMASLRKFCLNHPDIFGYICGSYTSKKKRKAIFTVMKRGYFDVKVGDQDKQWAPYCW